MTTLRAIFAAICIAVMSWIPAAWAGERVLTIAVPGQQSGDQALGDSICALINGGSADHGIKCSAPRHESIRDVINALRTDSQMMAIIPADWQFSAYNGTQDFKDAAFNDLRSVFSAQSRALTVLARKDSGLSSLDDLKGRRVNIGVPGSPSRALMTAFMEAKGWSLDDFSIALELKPAEQSAALCDEKADAIIFAAYHPDALVEETAKACDVAVLETPESELEAVLRDRPFYTRSEIPADLYAGISSSIETFGIRATVVTSAQMDQALVRDTVRIVFGEFDRLRALNATLARLDESVMIRSGLTAPLHPGAQRFFLKKIFGSG